MSVPGRKKKTYDPRELVKNPEIAVAMKAIKMDFKNLVAAKSFSERRGCAAILMAQIEYLMEQPEFIPAGIAPGIVPDGQRYFTQEQIPEADRFKNERPFDLGGETAGLYFFYTDTGKFSQLYDPPVMAPNQINILWQHGYFVHTLEKQYATQAPTENHVTEAGVCIRMLKEKGIYGNFSKDPKVILYLDPKGCSDSSSFVSYAIAFYPDYGIARCAADFLAKELTIRFLVANRIYSFCTH